MNPSMIYGAIAAIVFAGAAMAQTLPQVTPGSTRVFVEEAEFKNTACMNKANGNYCGLGSNRQLIYQCTDGQIVHQSPCAGGCDPNTLACKTEFGVKGIDPPKPQ